MPSVLFLNGTVEKEHKSRIVYRKVRKKKMVSTEIQDGGRRVKKQLTTALKRTFVRQDDKI